VVVVVVVVVGGMVVVVVVVVVGGIVVVVVVVVVGGGGRRAPTVTTQVSVRRERREVMTTRAQRRSATKVRFARTLPSCSKSRPPQGYVPLKTTPAPAERVHRLPGGRCGSFTTKGPPVLVNRREADVPVSARGGCTRRLVTGPLKGCRVDGPGG